MAITILRVIASIAAFAGAAIGMEWVARMMHKYIMHGQGWCLHYDHHNKRRAIFEKNDLYFFFFAGLSFVLIFFGLRSGLYEMAAAGFGVALYGIGYVLFHDIMFHRRFRWIKIKPNHPYLKRIINAHRMHHATVTQGGAVSFSFLWAPKFYAPDNQEEVDKKMAEIREMQLALKRREKERAAEAATTSAAEDAPPADSR